MKSRILSNDTIAMMTDDELGHRLSSLSGFITREHRRGNHQSELETEHSYLYREAEIREKRKTAHVAWLRSGGHLRNYEELYD